MKRFKVGMPTKKTGGLLVVAAMATALLGAGGMSAAYAADEPWTPQSTKSYFVKECQEPGGLPVLVWGETNVAEGESISDSRIDGNPVPGDAEVRASAGEHTYTYVVTNLNSTTDPKESVTKSGSFTVETCDTPDPSASVSINATPNDDGTTRSISVSGSVTLENIPDGATVTVVTTASSGASSTTTVTGGTFQTTLTGDFPDGAVSVSSQVYVNGAAVGSPGSSSVTFQPRQVEPKDPLLDGHLNGILTDDNKSAVHYVVTVDRGDAEGTLVVVISHGDAGQPDATLEFPGDTETLRGTFLTDTCGDIEFDVYFKDSTIGQTYTVKVPCPVTDDGNGNNGGGDGNHNGGTPGGTNNGGSDNNGTTNGTDTNGSTNGGTSNTNTVPGGKTDGFDLQASGVSPIALAGGPVALLLLIAIGVVAYARRQSLAGE